MSQGKTTIYKERAELNLKVLEILYFFGLKNEFIALIIQSPIENEASSTDDFTSFSRRVKHSTQVSVDKMENRLNQKIANIEK